MKEKGKMMKDVKKGNSEGMMMKEMKRIRMIDSEKRSGHKRNVKRGMDDEKEK